MMSSETSIESHGQIRTKSEPSEAFQPWQLFTLAGLVGATGVVFLAKGQSPAAVIFLSLTIFAAAAVGVAALRTVGPLAGLFSSEAPRAAGGRTRAALEREKTLVLRSIKDLEFDRAMGKLAEKDFVEMSHRLRARAAGLIRQLDAGAGYREQIEREVQRRVAPKLPAAAVARVCAACGGKVDADARFCKHCGANVEARS